jgi:hypothetical protein
MSKKMAKFQVETLEQRFEMGWSAKKIDYKFKTPEGPIQGSFELE